MDQSKRTDDVSSAEITLGPDMRPSGDAPQPPPQGDKTELPLPHKAQKAGHWPTVLATLGIVLGVASLGLAAWIHVEGQREILRLSTELAQLRVSLDLYARSNNATDLSDRLTALEKTQANVAQPEDGTGAAMPPPTDTSSASGDCLPVGVRLLVAAGDNYPICEQSTELTVSFVDNGYITLSDGTSVASGSNTPLPGNPACTLAVTSGGDEGLTGYAEIRVTC